MNSAQSEYGVVTEGGAIRFERLLPGPIERVWNYLVDSQLRARWLASGQMEQREGAEFELVWRNAELSAEGDQPPTKYAGQEEYRAKARVLNIDPPRLLVTSWNGEGVVSYELETRGDRVALTLTHRNVATRDLLVGIAGGWHTHLNLLRAELKGEPRFPFWNTHTRLEEEYASRIPH
jgi:uncharacterized protein YndB with AHSA1/START domain